jgi:hypothetical protein
VRYAGGISTTSEPLSERSTVYVGERDMRLAEEFAKWLSANEVEAHETADDPLDFARCPVNHLGSREFQLRKKVHSRSAARVDALTFGLTSWCQARVEAGDGKRQ